MPLSVTVNRQRPPVCSADTVIRGTVPGGVNFTALLIRFWNTWASWVGSAITTGSRSTTARPQRARKTIRPCPKESPAPQLTGADPPPSHRRYHGGQSPIMSRSVRELSPSAIQRTPPQRAREEPPASSHRPSPVGGPASSKTHRPSTTPGLPDVAQRADLARPAARWGGPPRIPAQRVAERMAPIGAEIPWGTAGTKDCRAGPRGLAGQALTASTVLASGAVAWWPLPVVVAWSAPPSVSIAILRGLAFSATGITNRSTPSR